MSIGDDDDFLTWYMVLQSSLPRPCDIGLSPSTNVV
jgi:hypothetical protein